MPLVLDGTNGVSGVDGTASNPAIEGTDSNTGIFFPAADTVAIGTGGTEALRVTSAQAVGVGTTSPQKKFVVSNSGAAGVELDPFTRSATTGASLLAYNRSGAAFVRMDYDASQHLFFLSGSQAMTLDANNVLYVNGTSQIAGSILNVRGNGSYIGVGGSTVQMLFGDNNSLNGFLGTLTNHDLTIRTNNTERARFTSGGHFCVGTTTVANTAFQATFFESSNGGIILQNGTNYSAVSCSSNDFYIDVGRGGTAGGFNIRTSSGLDFRFQIGSTGAMTCAGVYNNTVGATNRDVFVDNTGKVGYVASIRASKTNIKDLTDTSWLHQLNPVSFNYRKKDEEGGYTDETDGNIQYGLIAEDVEQVRPDLCFYDEVDGEQELRGIQYSKLVPVMLKEIQKLRAELNALKGNA